MVRTGEIQGPLTEAQASRVAAHEKYGSRKRYQLIWTGHISVTLHDGCTVVWPV